MKYKIDIMVVFILITPFSGTLQAKGGAGWGFLGGLVAGNVLSNIASASPREYYSPTRTVVQERVIDRPVYIQQQPFQATKVNSAEQHVKILQQINTQQQKIIENLQQQINALNSQWATAK